MFTVTRYCVQAFRRIGREYVPTEGEQFFTEAAARERARTMSRREPGVALYAVDGEPNWPLWRKPRLLVAYGDVPGAGASRPSPSA